MKKFLLALAISAMTLQAGNVLAGDEPVVILDEDGIHVNKVDSLLKEQADYTTGEAASVVLFGRMSGVNSETKAKQEVEMNKINVSLSNLHEVSF